MIKFFIITIYLKLSEIIENSSEIKKDLNLLFITYYYSNNLSDDSKS